MMRKEEQQFNSQRWKRNLEVATGKLSQWCLDRNRLYTHLRDGLYNPHVLTYERLAWDTEAEVERIRDTLGLPPSAAPVKSRLLKVHSAGAYEYIINEQAVRSFGPERFDYVLDG